MATAIAATQETGEAVSKLWCVDCLDGLKRVRKGSVNCMIADPPFGARKPSARRSASLRFKEVENNDRIFHEWLPLAFEAVSDGGCLYLFTCWDKMSAWSEFVSAVGFRVRSCIVWDKMVHGLADIKTCWAPQHELVLFAAKGRHELMGERPKDVIRCPRIDSSKLIHPYQKPMSLFYPMLWASTRKGDLVCDPFMGSGSVGAACVKLGRRFLGMEKDPEHFATAKRVLRAVKGSGLVPSRIERENSGFFTQKETP